MKGPVADDPFSPCGRRQDEPRSEPKNMPNTGESADRFNNPMPKRAQ
ncbi:hypothetical protein MAUB1S_08376 [Mycolicibacterium aubagnense]